MNLFAFFRKHFGIPVVVMLNLTLIFSDVCMAAEQSKKRRINNSNGGKYFKVLHYILHNLDYSNWNELYSNNLTSHIGIFDCAEDSETFTWHK